MMMVVAVVVVMMMMSIVAVHTRGLIPNPQTTFQLLLHPSYIHWLPNTQRLQALVVRHENLHLISPTCFWAICRTPLSLPDLHL